MVIAVAALSLVIWLYLFLFRGGFWRVSRELAPDVLPRVEGKRVCALIPARNEAAVIGPTIDSLLKQDFAGFLHIFLIDDNSTDGTAEAAGRADALTIVRGKPLAPGWSGKLWALSQALPAACELDPDYLLFTDGDIVHGRTSLDQLVSLAETRGYDLASLMVKLHCSTFAEKALIPAFVFFFFKLYPPSWINSPRRRTAGAAGGCILIRPHMLRKIGGLEAIRNEVIDDCALARAVKRNGGRVWLGLTRQAASTRSYGTAREIGGMISRTAFNQLRHSSLLLAATALGLVVTYLLPVALLFSANKTAAALGLGTWLLMSSLYLPMVRFYSLFPLQAFTLPCAAAFYLVATIHSAFQYWRGQGGRWKDRIQDRY
jgi:hopene-associated glycosyltransferase HpnB